MWHYAREFELIHSGVPPYNVVDGINGEHRYLYSKFIYIFINIRFFARHPYKLNLFSWTEWRRSIHTNFNVSRLERFSKSGNLLGEIILFQENCKQFTMRFYDIFLIKEYRVNPHVYLLPLQLKSWPKYN